MGTKQRAYNMVRSGARKVHLEPFLVAYGEARLSHVAWRDRQDTRNMRFLMRVLLHPSSNCVDIGASFGLFLREMVALAPRGHHYAFEPLPYRAAALEASYPGVDVRGVALSDHSGEATFVRVVENDTYSGLHRREYPNKRWQTEEITVPLRRLDDELPSDYRPELVKIDVEGEELSVLRGSFETLARHRPTIFFEHGYLPGDTAGPTDIHPLLTDAGYDVLDIDGNGPFSLDEMVDVHAQGQVWQWIARPHRDEL